jgi:peptidyl-prolyl cis-trans isomerase SurA
MRNVFSRLILALVGFATCMIEKSLAQSLLQYGDGTISKEEFLKAYQKNNNSGKPTEKSYRDYLELYTRYKLKVKVAYEMKLDTLSSQITERQNFRNQSVDRYMNDEASLNKLIREAFVRSQHDIHLAHIYIAIPKTALPADTLAAYKKAMQAYAALKNGKDFNATAVEYSEDPFAKKNYGDLGWITVFTFPHDLENLAYRTPTGHFSVLYRGKTGYHIFNNLGERKALGKMRAAQILLVFPFNPTDTAKAEVKQRADSLYNALIKGSDFSELARKFSGDNLSYQTGGEIAEFGVGKFDPSFEQAAFSLNKDGMISHPVASSYGYHIIKRLGRKEVSPELSKETFETLRQQVINDPRMEESRKVLLQRILGQTHLKRYPVNENNLMDYTKASLEHKSLPKYPGLDDTTLLFSFAREKYTVKDWLNYRKAVKNIPGSDRKSSRDLMNQYLQTIALDYYRKHAEDYNKDFAYQLNELKEGNLLFEIMQRTIWDKASVDSVGLKDFYEKHKDKYWWEASADAVIFTCSNDRAATDITHALKNNILEWKMRVDSSNGSIQADSGRFELSQLPMTDKNHLQAGQFTALVKNQTDNSVTVAYICKIYNDRSPRNFKDARGFIINDYQIFLENKWIAELKKKYPVKLNETVFRSLPRN